ncbi:glycosyl transferase family protein [Catenovulum sp. 2E275]|uniref:glycosyl transferase family protein n=1 Tax=Catenovulum sp. 2E275 TaxID=2980497 RepID=UPI0021D32A3C|nr:glycosyl transferase family protein [Catenovulum sp. 2E275]MCU4676795.1 glycosyl transferase family protein [Catenovulum sp. 2E275]
MLSDKSQWYNNASFILIKTIMSEPFKHYINLIGKGQRAGQTLTQAQAYDAMQQILQDKVTPEQLGAFLMLLRVREETAEELAGFTQACREYVNPEFAGLTVDLDMGCYAGKRRHLPWFLLAVMAMAQQGLNIAIHGTAEPDSQRLYLKTCLAEFGVMPAENKQEAEQQLDKLGFCYQELASVHPKLDQLIQLRALFGLRSPANTLARMLNPFNAEFSLHGVHHRNFDIRHIDAAQILQDKNVLCFRGEGGEIEFNPEREVTLHCARQGQTSQFILPAGLDSWQVKPRELDINSLKNVWLGAEQNDYATQAIIGTINIMLLLTQSQLTDDLSDSAEAIKQTRFKAEQIWQQRQSANWPLN